MPKDEAMTTTKKAQACILILCRLASSSLFMILSAVLLFTQGVSAQDQSVAWLNFEQLEDSLAVEPRPVFISFYADWCAYCKKMDRVAFRDPKVITRLNRDYLSVRMNAETRDTIVFGGQTYVNREFGRKRNPTHEIPLLLATRESYPFSLPAMILLNEEFEITGRYFEYLSPEELSEILKN